MFSLDQDEEEKLLETLTTSCSSLEDTFSIDNEVSCVYCSNGQLTREKLLSRTFIAEETFSESTVQLFGHEFVVSTLYSKLKELFLLFNQHLQLIQDNPNTQIEFEEAIRFLHCLYCYFHRCLSSPHASAQSVAMEAASELQLAHTLLTRTTEQITNTVHRLHLHVMWTSLTVSYHLIPFIGLPDFISQVLCVGKKLLSFTSTQFHHQNKCSDSWSSKLWLTLYLMLSTTHTEETFWSHISKLLTQQVVSSERSFSWWLLAELSTICGGQYWQVVHDQLLPLSLSLSVSDESQMRCVLQCVCKLTHQWTPSLQVVSKVWDLFYRNMNSTEIIWISPTVMLSASHWAHCVTEWQCPYFSSSSNKVDLSCFELFLRMLSCTITCTDHSVWCQVKGRIFSKLHSTWISKLESCGLQRVLSLFLVLSTTSKDQQAIASKALANLTPCLSKPLTVDFKSILWKGIFAHLIILQRNRLDLSPCVASLLPHLNHLATHLPNDINWKTLQVALGCVQELLELHTACQLGATDLIAPYLTELLSQQKCLEASQYSQLLLFVESVATSFAEQATVSSGTQITAGYLNLLQYCLPVLSSLSTCSSPPALLAQSAASLYHLSACSSTTKGLEYQVKLLEEFGLSEDCNPRIACDFLCLVLSDKSTDVNSLDPWRVAHCWLRCLLSCGCQLTQFTHLLSSLPVLSPYIQTKSTDPSLLLKQLLIAINTNFYKLYVVSSEECSIWRRRLAVFLGDIVKYWDSVSSIEMNKMGLLVTSLVVSSCPRIIYSKLENKCLLPQIVDRVVLPLATGKVHQIRPYLHMYLIGLFQLDPEKDGFIRRKLKQIFGKYFQVYAHQLLHPLMSHLANPFLMFLESSDPRTSPEDLKQRLGFTIEIIASEYLAQSLAKLLPVVHFLVCMTKTVNHTQLTSCMEHLLFPLLSCLFKCTESSSHVSSSQVKDKVLYLLHEVLRESSPPYERLLVAVRQYLTLHLTPFNSTEAVIGTLSFLADYIPSWKEYIGNISREITSQECQRTITQCLTKFR